MFIIGTVAKNYVIVTSEFLPTKNANPSIAEIGVKSSF